MSDRSKKSNKLAQLAELKRTREGGKREWKQEDVQIYDKLSEDQYQSLVKGRLQRDDFVVDDGVAGYTDNGMDDWIGGQDGNNDADEDEDDDERTPKKRKKPSIKRPPTKAKSSPKPKATHSMSAYRPSVSQDQELAFMEDLIGDMDEKPTGKRSYSKPSRKRKSSPGRHRNHNVVIADDEHSYRRTPPVYTDASSDPFDEVLDQPPSDDDVLTSPKKKARITDGSFPNLNRIQHLNIDVDYDASFGDMDMDLAMELDPDSLDVKPIVKQEEVSASNLGPFTSSGARQVSEKKPKIDEKPSWLSVYNSLQVSTEGDTDAPSVVTSASVRSGAINSLETDGSFRFFWLDYLENDGKVYFIGKVNDKKTGAWVSCCVTVEGIKRNVFLLPRPRRVEQDEDGNLVETDIVPTMDDVKEDFERVRKHWNIKNYRTSVVTRSYAFDELDVPREKREWLKVVYDFSEPKIGPESHGPNFHHIFGTNTNAFELLVLKRKIMGPCWLQVKKPRIQDNKSASWCKLEVVVADPKDVNPFPETDALAPKDMPPLNVMSLSVRTIVNHKENKRELVCASARTWINTQIDDPTPPEKQPATVQTFVRPLDRFPPNFEARAKQNGKGTITPVMNERMLLSNLLQTVYRTDPDVIIGHEFIGTHLDVLLQRLRDLKLDHWSRMGRFRRQKMPNIGRQGTNGKFLNGRLICDLTSDAAKGMISSTTWTMTEMCKTHLKMDRQEIDPDDTANYLDGSVGGPDRLLTFVRHCELDAHYQMAIAAKVQMLPLTKQLTNLAGNSWNRTLNGGRAERNEYILLHEFHRLKYICPDKSFGKKAAPIIELDDEGNEMKVSHKSKRDKYKGGLVFEPKRGLWDKYILVMDFNSLYPSIIQEYNIDFTTVERVEMDENNEEKMAEPPSPEVPQGVLPRLIAQLVSRRRHVKALMKDRTIPPAKLLQYDIKQQALKLTANSMYGCLGFEYSRFYAKPLAALTTFKGREILTHTRELAESMQLDVVYGDTDSVFVNTNASELSEALKISADFKKAVNDRYKLLEIDLDGVFQRLLLLQKKKYAALKVEEGSRTSTEIKGLDMKRREYCALSKTVSQYVLEQILSGESPEVVVENIHDYLHTIGRQVREGQVKIDEFIIFKRLGKDPTAYPDKNSQPHVQVALRMNDSQRAVYRAGDVIPYVFCKMDGEEAAKTAQAERAKHPEEVRRNGLIIDFEYYLSQQILPPIERLCDPIEGTERARLAECLGLDPQRYRSSSSEDVELSFSNLSSQMSDKQRFKDAIPFQIRCTHCGAEFPFTLVSDQTMSCLSHLGPTCTSCNQALSTPSLQLQLEMQIRNLINQYYEHWAICDDETCGNRVRDMSVAGWRCLRLGCRGTTKFEFSDAKLYNQLLYFSSLFDENKILESCRGSPFYEKVENLVKQSEPNKFLTSMTSSIQKYLDQCGRRWVDLNQVFSFMKLAS